MMKKIIILFFVAAVCGCQNKENKVILNKGFKTKLMNYIQKNPIESSPNEIFGKEIPKPIYQVFFEKRNLDTIITIKLVPHLIPFSVLDNQKKKDSLEFSSEIDCSGHFLINKIPVVVFDSNGYSKDIIIRENLKNPLPDIYKFEIGKINKHLKSRANYYKLSNNNLEDISIDDKEN
jgi:hypothetical protein